MELFKEFDKYHRELYKMGFYNQNTQKFFSTFIPLLENGGIYEEKNFEVCFTRDGENIQWTGQKNTYLNSSEDVSSVLYYDLQSSYLTHILLDEKIYHSFNDIEDQFSQKVIKGVSVFFEKLGLNRYYNLDGKNINSNFFYNGNDMKEAIIKLARDFFGDYDFLI